MIKYTLLDLYRYSFTDVLVLGQLGIVSTIVWAFYNQNLNHFSFIGIWCLLKATPKKVEKTLKEIYLLFATVESKNSINAVRCTFLCCTKKVSYFFDATTDLLKSMLSYTILRSFVEMAAVISSTRKIMLHTTLPMLILFSVFISIILVTCFWSSAIKHSLAKSFYKGSSVLYVFVKAIL